VDLIAVTRQSLSEAVFEQLRDQILSGQVEAGEALPSERVLCEQLGVNRSALREALRRLQQLRLISVRQGGATTVLDYREHGGLELLVSLVAGPNGGLRPRAIRSFVEMRAALAPDIAGLAARRRSTEQVGALREALETLRECSELSARHAAHLQLWSVGVDASSNVAYRLMFNTLRRALDAVGPVVAAALAPELNHTPGYVAMVDAIAKRRSKAAAEAATELVSRGTRSMLRVVAQLEAA